MSTDSPLEQQDQAHMPRPSADQFEKLVEVISRSQRGYRALIDSLDQALFTLSPTGEVLVANLRLAEILGISFSDLIGHSFSEFIEWPLAEEVALGLGTLLAKGSWSGTLAVRLKGEQEVRHFSCWFQSVLENGQVMSITGWARDVSREREAEVRFSELFESIGDGIVFATPEGTLVDANPALVRMLGYENKQEMQTHNVRDLYADPADRAALIRELEEKGSVQNREIMLRRKDGKTICCLTSGFAIRDASGRPVRLQGMIVDITERAEIEKRLHEEQEFARRLVECFPHLITVLDRKGRFTFVSERVRDVLGVTPEDYIGKPIGQRIDAENRQKLLEMHRDIISGRKRHAQLEGQVRHADGSLRSIQINASPLYDEKGEIVGMVSSGQDVTESRRIEQQLLQKEKFAAMGRMMVGAAHELNNPLTAILGVADLLRERAPDDAIRRQVDLVLKQARRAATIVQNLLAFSRPVALGRTKINLADIAKDALRQEQAALDQKTIRVTFESPDTLPSIEGDGKLLKEVFVNIIANAEQAISAARDHGTLAVKLSVAGAYIRVTFADDGVGIPPESIGKIFDPFFTTKRTGGSSGLGLTICLAVVKEHGGRIETESELGAGTAFHVLLPVSAEGVSATRAPEVSGSAKQTIAGSAPLRGHTAVVVDDEDSIREIVQEGLSVRGMKVEAFGSSETALAYLATNQCDVVVCDFNLPTINGEQLFERLRIQQSGKIPRFIFMTGDLFDPATSDRYRHFGVTILQKPFHVAALADLLAEILKPRPAQVG
jgi:PAS domain S-box-containing protein